MKGEKGKREGERERDRRKETRLLGSSTNEKYTDASFNFFHFKVFLDL